MRSGMLDVPGMTVLRRAAPVVYPLPVSQLPSPTPPLVLSPAFLAGMCMTTLVGSTLR